MRAPTGCPTDLAFCCGDGTASFCASVDLTAGALTCSQ
jgi:hypothetical protein